jgi:ketosteroid isomerase-like protein
MRRTLPLVLALGVTAFGCGLDKEGSAPPTADRAGAPKTGGAPKHEPSPPAPLTGTALADKYTACTALINDAQFDDFKKDCAEADYTVHAVAGRPEVRGIDNLIGVFRDRKSAMPDWKLQPQLIMISGRTILAVNLVTGTHTGTLKMPTGPVAATNKKVGQLMFHRLAVNDANHATDEWAYADGATMLAQLGIVPKGTPPKRPALDKGWDGAPIVLVSADDANEKANLELVKKMNRAFVENTPAALLATYSDDVTDMDQGSARDVKGKKELEKGFIAFRNAWSVVKVSNVEAWAAGDYVVQSFTFEGKHGKTGRMVSVDAAQVMHVKDRKVDQLWAF